MLLIDALATLGLAVLLYVVLTVLGRLWGVIRPWVPYGDVIHGVFLWPVRVYVGVCRSLTPDWLYRAWYRAGIMSEEDYRAFQERGYISNELDPAYLERYDE